MPPRSFATAEVDCIQIAAGLSHLPPHMALIATRALWENLVSALTYRDRRSDGPQPAPGQLEAVQCFEISPGTSERVSSSHITLYSQNAQHAHVGFVGVVHRLRLCKVRLPRYEAGSLLMSFVCSSSCDPSSPDTLCYLFGSGKMFLCRISIPPLSHTIRRI